MPPKKKQPANAFYFYMVERKVHYENNGDKFPNGLKDVAEVAGPEWAVLPPSSRKKYEDMAKEEKARQKGDPTRKYTNQNRPFHYVERAQAEEEEAKLKMNKDIETTIRTLCETKKIAEFKFYLIHVNYFCITEGDCYHPAELAVAEFSLSQGVTHVYHTIINPGKIPLGYRSEAMKNTETVHGIPIQPEEGEIDIYEIWRNVKRVLGRGRNAHGGAYPPMYTMPDNINLNTSISCVRSVVQNFCDGSDDNPADFPIYQLDKLFYELKNSVAEFSGASEESFWPSIPFAFSRLEDDTYNYAPDIACDFHLKEDQVVNCSKSFVQRWAYLICDMCCQDLDIQLVPGQHVPLNSDVDFNMQIRNREKEKEAEAAVVKPYTLVQHSHGKAPPKFLPVQIEDKPLRTPNVQSSLAKPGSSRPPVFQQFDNSEEHFPAISIAGRGRGRIPKNPGAGNPPMSFAAAAQKK